MSCLPRETPLSAVGDELSCCALGKAEIHQSKQRPRRGAAGKMFGTTQIVKHLDASLLAHTGARCSSDVRMTAGRCCISHLSREGGLLQAEFPKPLCCWAAAVNQVVPDRL